MSYINDKAYRDALLLTPDDAHYVSSYRGGAPTLFVGNWAIPSSDVEYLRLQRDNHAGRTESSPRRAGRLRAQAWAHLYDVAATAVADGLVSL